MPAGAVARAAAGMLAAGALLAATSPAAQADAYVDVPSSHPFYDEIEWLAHAGISLGYADATFQPGDPMTRQGTAAFLHRMQGEPAPTGDPGFDDVPSSHPFHDAIAWMVDEGITTGYPDDTFRPGDPMTRQGTAAFLHRLKGGPDADGYGCAPPTVVLQDEEHLGIAERHTHELALDDGDRIAFEGTSRYGSIRWQLTRDASDGGPAEVVFDERTLGDTAEAFEIISGGDFILEIFGFYSDSTGDYGFTASDVTRPSCFQPVGVLPFQAGADLPSPGVGDLSTPGEHQQFEVSFDPGDWVALMSDGDPDIRFELTRQADAAGPREMIVDRDVSWPAIAHELDTGGDYLLEVYGLEADTTGDYELELVDVTAPALETSIDALPYEVTGDAPVDGAGMLEIPGERHRYHAAFDPGDRVHVTGTGDYDVMWRLTRQATASEPQAVIFEREVWGTDAAYDLPVGGDYVLEVLGERFGDATDIVGDYEFTLSEAP